MAEENDNINPGPIDQSRQLVDQIQESIRTILQLSKQIGLSQEAQNAITEEYNNKLSQAKGNTNLLQQLNEELSSRINNIAQNTDEYASDISSVSSELDRIVGSISTTSDFSRTVLKDFKSLRDTAFNIRNDRDLTRVMSVEELNNSKEQVAVDKKSLETQVQRASAELNFNAIVDSIKQTQQDIVSAVLEQDNAVRSANGRLGGQTRQLNEIRSYFSQINELATNENINTEKAIKLSEQRNQISSVLNDALNNNITKSVEEEELVRSIISKLENKEQITRSEFGLMTQILNRKEQGFKEERDSIVKASKVTKENLTTKSQQLDLARSIITELRTEGKLSADSNGSIQEKVAVLEQNQDLLKGLNNTEKTRLIKAIESNKVLANNKTLYESLTSEIESSILREKDLAKTMGVTGSIVKEFSKIPVLASVFKAEDVKEVTDEVRRLNKEYQDKASLETAKNRNELVTVFTQIQETSNILTEDQSKQLAEITQKIENKQKLTEEEISIAQNLSSIVLENTDIEEKRREVLDKISTLNEEDKKSLEILTSKIEERKTLTEEELKLLEEKTEINTKNLNINDKILTNIKEQGVNIEANVKKVTQLDAAGKMLGKVMGNLKQTLTDPAAILTAIGAALLRNSQLTNQFQQELGIGYGNALAMRNALSNAAGASGDLFINSEKLQKSFFALKETTGVFFDISSQSAETFTNLTERIGLAGAEAGNLTTLMRLQGKETENVLGNLYDTTGAMLQTSKTTASVKDILGDVAKTSKGLQASLASNPQALAKAAIAAREFGSTLAQLEGIQGNLLDFEQSIGAELEAELLTGKQLNLEKARAAALNNDMATLGEELKKQNVDLASFGDMNVKQQEAIAKAMGMNRNELGETLLKQEMQNKTLEEIRSTMGKQAYEQAKALSAQDKFNAAVSKVKDLFANVMTALTPVIDVLAAMLQPIAWVAKWLGKLNELTGGWSNALIGVAIAAKALGISFGSLFNPATYAGFFKGITNNVSGISFGSIKDKLTEAFAPGSTDGFFDGIKERFKGLTEPLKGLKDKLTGAFSGAANKAAGIEFDPRMAGGGRFRDMASGRMVSEEVANTAGVFKPGEGPAAAVKGVTDKASGAAEKAGKTVAPKDTGKALKEKMQNIAKGLKAFADPKVIQGGLSLLVSAPGLIALGVASLPLKLVEKLNGKTLQAGMKGIANGLKAFADPMAILGGLSLIPISLGLAAMAVGSIGLAGIALLGVPAAAGMAALGAGLATLGAVAATGAPFLGVALIGALGAALIPFGAALALAAPAVIAVGTAIAGVITAIAGAVTTVLPALTQSLIDLATNVPLGGLLGLALTLPSLAVGVGILGVTLLTSAPGFLVGAATLPLIAPALAELNAAIAGIDGAGFLAFSAGIMVLGAGLLTATPGFLLGALTLPILSPALTQLSEAISGIDGGNFALFSLGMVGLAGGLTIMGAALPFVLAGIGAFTLFGAALRLAAPGIEAAGNAVEKIGNSIANIGNAIANILVSAGAAIFAIGKSISTTVSSLTQSLIDLTTKIPLTNLLAIGAALPIFGIGLAAFGSGVLMAIPGLVAGALVLPLITSSLAGLSGTLAGINGENLLMVGAGIAGLAGGLTVLGVAAPFALIGAGVLSLVSLALIPLGSALMAVSPALDIFTGSFERLTEIDGGSLLGLATGIGALGLVVSGLAVMSPLIIIGSGALAVLGLSMSNAAESMKALADVSSDSMIGFASALTMLGTTAAFMGTISPLIGLGAGSIFLLGEALDPAAEAMKQIAGIGADSMIGFATSLTILGTAATQMGILAPLVALGAGTIYLIGSALEPAAIAMQNLAGISADSMIGFATSLTILGGAASFMGTLAPLVALGTGTIYLLGQAIAPAAEAMQNLVGISADSMIGFSVALNLLGNAAAGMGVLSPLVLLGTGAITLLGIAITPAAEAMQNLAGISADAILSFTFGLSQLSTTTALIGAFAPVIAMGAGAIYLLGKAIVPAAEAMKNLAGISADAILGFSTGLSMLGSAASMLGVVAPLVVLGAGALYVLGNALTPAAKAFAVLEGLNASTMLGFASALTILGTASALFGALSPAIILGAGALYILGSAIAPTAEAFKMLEGLDPAVMAGFASSLFVLGSSAAFFGALSPLVLLGAGAIAILGLTLKPLAELAPKLNLTSTALKGIATSVALLATSLNSLDAAKLETLSDFKGTINVSSASAPTTSQTTTATSTIDQASVATNTVTNTATNTVDKASTATNAVNTVDKASTATNAVNTVDKTSVATNTATITINQASISTNTATNTVDKTLTAKNAINTVDKVSTAANAVNTIDKTSVATNAVNTVDKTSIATNTATITINQASISTNTVDKTSAATNTANIVDKVSAATNIVNKASATTNVDKTSVATNTANTIDKTSVATNTANIVDKASVATNTATITINQASIATNTANIVDKTSAATNTANIVDKASAVKNTANIVDKASAVKNTANIVDKASVATNTANIVDKASVATNTIDKTSAATNTISTTDKASTVTNTANTVDLNPKSITNELVPGISVTTPSPTTTQETLTTNTENLSTATFNAATNLEKLNTLLPTTLSTSPIQSALGTNKTETSLINQASKELVPGISVATPQPSSVQTSTSISQTETALTDKTTINALEAQLSTIIVDKVKTLLDNGKTEFVVTVKNLATDETFTGVGSSNNPKIAERQAEFNARQEAVINTITPKTENIINPVNNTTSSVIQKTNKPITQQQGISAEEVEGIVASTIKALVPEMVAALNNVKVVNDNFNNSRQSEGPSRNRNITNNNFA